MRRTVALTALFAMLLTPLLLTADAWARAGGGSSGGSRGSRSYSSPARPSASPASPSQPASPLSSQQPAPQRPGWGGMLGGLLVGGLIGSLLFGGLGGGLFGGIGLLEIVVIGALAWFAFAYMRRQQASAATSRYAAPGGFAAPAGYAGASGAPVATAEAPAGSGDLDRGLGFIRQMDAGFDPARFADTAEDIFFKVQAAWIARDMSVAAGALADEMRGILQRDCDRLRAEGKINRLENIAVRSAELTEAWQERGQDYVTVRFLANLLDYTTDESGARVVEGSRTEPVKFEEYWTFVRPVGPNPWRLSAIQQP
jgi:predicted lipid-binding transport protein (Tim44 family)